jgi:hypothetical protein
VNENEQQHPLTGLPNSGNKVTVTFLLELQICSLAEIPRVPARKSRRIKKVTVCLNIMIFFTTFLTIFCTDFFTYKSVIRHMNAKVIKLFSHANFPGNYLYFWYELGLTQSE